MESALRCMPDEDGRKQEGGLCLDLGRVYPDLHDQPRKLIRTDTPPFWIVPSSRSPTTAWGGSTAGSPPSPHLFASLPALGHRGVYHSLGGEQWTQRPLAAPFRTAGMAGDATLQVCSPFTAAQRHELHRQALIFKCFMASTPVPLELLFSGPRAFPDDPSPLPSCFDYLNLRFTGNSVDVEPSRCRRTDGKKWRCSKDVGPGHKYCERHMHRARPRSRKPVEHDKRTGPASADGAAALPTTSAVTNHAAPANTADPSPVATTSSPGVFPTADLKFPFQLMVPQVSCLGSGRGDAEQWQLLHSKMDPINPRSVWQQQQQQQRRRRLNLNCTSLNNHRAADPDQRDTPPQLIDALSRENYFGFTISDKGYHHQINGCSRSCVPQPGNPSPSNLTLSMSGSSEDHDENQTGLGTSGGDSVKAEAASWTNPVVPHFGGPLAEVLQSRSTVSFQNECEGGGESVVAAPCGWPLDLMSKSSCVSEGASPRDSRTTRFS